MAFTCDNEPLEPSIIANNNNNNGNNNNTTTTCQEAIEAAVEASLNYVNATDENENELCLALVDAIQAQIEACGDNNGELQSALDALEC